MKKIFTWLDKNFEPLIMVVLFYAIMILLTTQVFLRFVFDAGFAWGEEVSRFMFVWLMYFSISYATRNHRHINITFLRNILNYKGQKIIMIIVDFLFLFFSVGMFVSAIKITQSVAKFNDKATTVDVSMNIIYGAGLIGFALIIIRIIQGIVWKFKNFSEKLNYFENRQGKYSGGNEICFISKKDEIKKGEA